MVKTYSNADAKFTTYLDTYKIYVYGRVDPVAVFKKALDLTVKVPLNEVVLEVQSTKILQGKGRLTITKDNSDRKRCIITVKNSDTMCLGRAIVTAHANINKNKWTTSQLKNGFNKSRELQGTEAIKLQEGDITDYTRSETWVHSQNILGSKSTLWTPIISMTLYILQILMQTKWSTFTKTKIIMTL